jgi:hypothetical protein
MFIESNEMEGRSDEAAGVLTNHRSFKRERKTVNRAPEGGSRMVLWQVEPNGWDEV